MTERRRPPIRNSELTAAENIRGSTKTEKGGNEADVSFPLFLHTRFIYAADSFTSDGGNQQAIPARKNPHSTGCYLSA